MIDGPPPHVPMRTFLAVVEDRSVARAALRLHRDKRQVWRLVYAFERYVNGAATGTPTRDLAMRLVTAEGLLTPAGERIGASVRSAVQALDAIRDVAHAIRSGTGFARVACYPAQAPSAARAAQRLPDVIIDLVEVDDVLRLDGGIRLLDMVREARLDVAIVPTRTAARADALEVAWLYDWDLVAVGDGPPGRAGTVDARELDRWAARDGNRVMVGPHGLSSRNLVRDHMPLLRVAFESASVGTLYAMAEEGWGVAVMPGDAIPIQRGRSAGPPAKALTDGGQRLGHGYAVVHRTERRESPVSRFVRELRRTIRDGTGFGGGDFVNVRTRRSQD